MALFRTDVIAGHRVIRSRRRTISIEISEDGNCVIRAPFRAPQSAIRAFVSHKQPWIIRHQEYMRAKFADRPRYRFVTGEEFPVLGKWHNLCVVSKGEQSEELVFYKNNFSLLSDARPRAREVFRSWYQQYGLRIIEERVEHYSAAVGITPQSVRMSRAESQWGSCSQAGVLRFSWRVPMAPIPIVDAIAAHEVAHLVEKNHSDRFHKLLRELCPQYDERNRWLKEYQNRLTL